MLLGFVLLGRSLEEKARIRASSDMNELLVSCNLTLSILANGLDARCDRDSVGS